MDDRAIRAFVKAMLGEARIGVQEQTLEDAVAHATGQPIEAVRAANRHRADLGAVALDARHGRLEPARVTYFTPVDPMLAQPAVDAADAVRRLGTPLWVEDKYDGVRCQLHKVEGDVRLFSRDRRDLTAQFPEVVAAFAAAAGRYVLDGEVLAMEGGRALPFLRLQQRLGRLAPPPEVVAAHPVAFVAFDCLAHDETSLLDAPLRARRAALEGLALPPGQPLAPVWTATSAEELEALFRAAQARGNEGLMAKAPESPYASGRRGAQWLKIKRPLETLDVVVVGAEWGHGRRRAVLSDLTFAVRDEATGQLVTIGKAYNGLTDAEIRDDDRAPARPHRRGPRSLPDGATRDRPRGGLQPPPALGPPRLGLRAAIPAHRAHPDGPIPRERQHARRRGAARGGRGGRRGAAGRAGLRPPARRPRRHDPDDRTRQRQAQTGCSRSWTRVGRPCTTTSRS